MKTNSTTMKKLYLTAVLALCSIPLFAATDKEMEEARTYTAQAYLRYANDASGYLDEISVKTMAELKGKLKAQELENLKTFESVGVPKDYASWDKAKLSEYWSKTFFTSPGLLEKGRHNGAKARVKRKIDAMTVTAGASTQTSDPTPESSTGADPLEGLEADPNAAAAAATALPDSIEEAAKKLEDAILEEEDTTHKQGNSYTWVYIAILAALIGVVIWLVIFASKVMKRSEEREERQDNEERRGRFNKNSEETSEARLREAGEETTALRERFAATIAGKNDEMREVRRGADILRAENDRLKNELEKVRGEVSRHKAEAAQYKEECGRLFEECNTLREKLSHAQAAAAAAPITPAHNPAPEPSPRPRPQETVTPQPRQTTPTVKTIFLGRANARGLFVRADRNLNIGHTIFRLDTTDGYAGTFRVAADPAVWETALLNPTEALAGACVAPDMTATAGMSRIVTEAPGTAIFEGGCWKVIRKAKVRFEP